MKTCRTVKTYRIPFELFDEALEQMNFRRGKTTSFVAHYRRADRLHVTLSSRSRKVKKELGKGKLTIVKVHKDIGFPHKATLLKPSERRKFFSDLISLIAKNLEKKKYEDLRFIRRRKTDYPAFLEAKHYSINQINFTEYQVVIRKSFNPMNESHIQHLIQELNRYELIKRFKREHRLTTIIDFAKCLDCLLRRVDFCEKFETSIFSIAKKRLSAYTGKTKYCT